VARVTAAIVVAAAAIAGIAVHGRAAADPPPSCPVTIPPKAKPMGGGFSASHFNYGNRRLRAQLNWPRGTLAAGILPDGGARALVNKDGSIYVKVGWWRGVRGQLKIWGRRLDAPAPRLRADPGLVASYGHDGFVPSMITFPTVGCWRVTGGVKDARLSFFVRVTKLAGA
jgi:hypothetical protein